MLDVIEHCYEAGLRIYHTNWRYCTLDYDSESCLVIRLHFLVYHCTCRLPDSFEHLINSCSQHCFCSWLHSEFVTKRRL